MRGRSDGTRVVSLVPSVTETLLAWGVAPVAVTRFCEAPGVPTVGGTKNPDVDAIVVLRPDLVVMDKEENRADDADALEASGLTVHVTHVRAMQDVAPTLAELASALGLSGVPGDPVDRLGPLDPLDPLDQPLAASTGPRAWVPIWRRPWMTISGATYGSSILTAAGIVNVYEDATDPYPTVTLEAVADLHPDVVLAPSEPYPFAERHRSQLEAVAPAVFVDGQDLFWWGSRTGAAVARLRQLASGLPSQ
jgi:ABC-type Fe3+-hydroxamate transport system substrate-binding protein